MPGPPGSQTLHSWKPNPGGRVPSCDVCLARLQPLGHCDQCSTWVLDATCKLRAAHPDSERGSYCEKMVTETHEGRFQKGWRTVSVASFRSKKKRSGNGEVLGIVLSCSLLESKRSPGSLGRERLRAGVLSPPPAPNWNPVNKNLFPSTQIFWTCIKERRGRTLCCMVTILITHDFLTY